MSTRLGHCRQLSCALLLVLGLAPAEWAAAQIVPDVPRRRPRAERERATVAEEDRRAAQRRGDAGSRSSATRGDTRGDESGRTAARPAATGRAGEPAPHAIQPLPAPPHPVELAPAPGGVQPAGPIPAAAQTQAVALVGGIIHPIHTDTIEGGTVLFADGRIVAVGREVEIPSDTRVIELNGRHVYPGLIAADTVLGLVEIGAVRATRDQREVGDINPNARAVVAVDPDSELLPVTRSNGVLVALTAPREALISGTAAVIALDGWTWEDMRVRDPAALFIEWPEMAIDRERGDAKAIDKRVRARDEKLRSLGAAFADASAYLKGRDAEGTPGIPSKDHDVKWEAMIRALKGEIPVVVHADDILQIKAALGFASEHKLRLIIDGGRDAWRLAAELKRAAVPVLVDTVLEVGREWEAYDSGFTTPLKLYEAGVEFCIVDRGAASNARNLPYVAAKAAAYGLPPNIALRAITQYPARILGLGDRLGTIEPGKDATLFVSDGDPLDGRSNVLQAFIRGAELDLSDRHKRLYERFRRKPRRNPS